MSNRPRRSIRPPAISGVGSPGVGSGTSTPTSNQQSNNSNGFSTSTSSGIPSYSYSSATPHSMSITKLNPSSNSNSTSSSSKLPPSWLISSDSTPFTPNLPIGPGQAKYSTFASRMRAGVTGLMTPTPSSEGELKDPLGGRIRDRAAEKEKRMLQRDRDSNNVTVTASGRRSTVNYNEDQDDSDLLVEEAKPRPTPVVPPKIKVSDPMQPEIDWTHQYLGMPPPGNKIVVRQAAGTAHHHFSEADLARAALRPEVLIPIRIELETETHRIKDVFTWNVNETLLKPSHFAEILATDLNLPFDPYVSQIEAAIYQQIEDLGALAEIQLGPAKGGIWRNSEDQELEETQLHDSMVVSGFGIEGRDGKESRQWDYGIKEEFEKIKEKELKRLCEDGIEMERFREEKERLRIEREEAKGKEGEEGNDNENENENGEDEDEDEEEEVDLMGEDLTVEEMMEQDEMMTGKGDWEDDIRVVVDYDLHILRHHLRDKIEWDLCSPLTPEAFSEKLCSDLSLSSEAACLISNVIRDQLLNHKRAAVECDLIGGGRTWEKSVREIKRGDFVDEKREKEKARLKELGGEPVENGADGKGKEKEKEKEPEKERQIEVEEVPFKSTGLDGIPNPSYRFHKHPQASISANPQMDGDETMKTAQEGTSAPRPRSSRSRSRSPTRLRASKSPSQSQSQIQSQSQPQTQPNSLLPSTSTSQNPTPSIPLSPTSSTHSLKEELTLQQIEEKILSQRHSAYITIRELLSRGPRPLEDVWRDWYEGKEFGPLLQRLTEEDLGKLEIEAIRAGRRNRREQARFGGPSAGTTRYRNR